MKDMFLNDRCFRVFVVMPFGKKDPEQCSKTFDGRRTLDEGYFNDVYDSIGGACSSVERVKNYRIICERVDKITFSKPIGDKIRQKIREADIIIADLTQSNPNVLYEVGYSQCCYPEKVILTAYSVEDVCFDIRHYQIIQYKGVTSAFRKQLEGILSDKIDQIIHDNYKKLSDIEPFLRWIKIGDSISTRISIAPQTFLTILPPDKTKKNTKIYGGRFKQEKGFVLKLIEYNKEHGLAILKQPSNGDVGKEYCHVFSRPEEDDKERKIDGVVNIYGYDMLDEAFDERRGNITTLQASNSFIGISLHISSEKKSFIGAVVTSNERIIGVLSEIDYSRGKAGVIPIEVCRDFVNRYVN